jgi:hypothetical protein
MALISKQGRKWVRFLCVFMGAVSFPACTDNGTGFYQNASGGSLKKTPPPYNQLLLERLGPTSASPTAKAIAQTSPAAPKWNSPTTTAIN